MEGMFHGCKKLKGIKEIIKFNTNEISDMYDMFF